MRDHDYAKRQTDSDSAIRMPVQIHGLYLFVRYVIFFIDRIRKITRFNGAKLNHGLNNNPQRNKENFKSKSSRNG
jgi:hypothetical protein